ncbi:MAG: hypothetical protein IMW90_16325 [Thermogemmatispora sp.]|uniref:hypothetical protein n=1 Tax=Thermogemmatispora sp. TaxID=1968838 RepID=UPI0019E3AFE2|nr:hypothetical protein [Thermogemmatispora sp.]MBE3567284.1 hypothetical protein [Thermogemmatispora sp.]
MFLHMKPWIQALLLLSPRRPPGFDQLVEELRSRFGGEQARSWSEDVLGDIPIGEQEIPQPPQNQPSWHIRRIGKRASVTLSEGRSVRDTIQDEPFWPGLLQPQVSLLLSLGNGVVVARLPQLIPFIIYCVVCGEGNPELSFEISGPYDQATPARSVLRSAPRSLQMRPLSLFLANM